VGSPLRRLRARLIREDGRFACTLTDLRVHPDHVVALAAPVPEAGVAADVEPRTVLALITGEEWRVEASIDEVEALLWPQPVEPTGPEARVRFEVTP